jgi:capsular exopolysaccharide synthesis family protein
VKKEYRGATLPTIETDFDSGMRVERVAGSQIVKINYISYEPDFSALAANAIADEFIGLHFERKLDTTRKATDFLEHELRNLKKKVDQAEADLLQYARKHSILDTDARKENVILQRFGFLNNEVGQAQKTLIARQADHDELKAVTVDQFPESLRSPAITTLESTVLQAEQELTRLRTQFGENWPQVIQKRRELELARRQLTEEKSAAISRARKDTQIRYNSARAEYEKLSSTLQEQQQLVDRLNEASIKYNNLKREADAGDQLYQNLLQRWKETGVSAGLELSNIRITDRAKSSLRPYAPKPGWNISLALLLGLSTGMVIAFYLEYMDRSVRKPADLEMLGLPLLGWIPAISMPKKRKALDVKNGMGQSILKMPNEGAPSLVPAVALSRQDVRARESYRSLLAALLLSKAEKPARTILVTSAIAQEGKTVTLANLGLALAETGFQTLLVDSDFRNPSLSRRFGLSNGKGLSIYLAGGEIDIRGVSQPNLYVLPAGPVPPNPVALLTASRFSETLERLREKFQFILIDSPPVLALADAAILASKVDGVILVVRAGVTPQEVVTRANLQLVRSGASVLGAALNHVDLRNPEYSSYKKYYYNEKYHQANA